MPQGTPGSMATRSPGHRITVSNWKTKIHPAVEHTLLDICYVRTDLHDLSSCFVTEYTASIHSNITNTAMLPKMNIGTTNASAADMEQNLSWTRLPNRRLLHADLMIRRDKEGRVFELHIGRLHFRAGSESGKACRTRHRTTRQFDNEIHKNKSHQVIITQPWPLHIRLLAPSFSRKATPDHQILLYHLMPMGSNFASPDYARLRVSTTRNGYSGAGDCNATTDSLAHTSALRPGRWAGQLETKRKGQKRQKCHSWRVWGSQRPSHRAGALGRGSGLPVAACRLPIGRI